MWANIGECEWTPAGAVVCAAFCGMRAWIQGRESRYRSTVGETPGVPGAGGEGGALGVSPGRWDPARLRGRGPGAACGVRRLVPGGGRRQAEVAQNAMESSP